ncbi:MAG: hypothetical protein ACR2F6_01445 [Mycobacteriales bacterium]
MRSPQRPVPETLPGTDQVGLIELARTALAGRARPEHGGERPQLVITIGLAEMR